MRIALPLFTLLLASAVRAGSPQAPAVADPTSSPVDERSFYYHTSRNYWWGDVVSRKDINLSSDIGALDDLCFIPPAADWISDGAPEEIQKKYLNLVWRAAYSVANAQGKSNLNGRTIGSCGVSADAQIVGLGDFSNFYVGSFDEGIKTRTGFTSCRRAQDYVRGSPKYASRGKTMSNAGAAVLDTLNMLLKSKHPETVLAALGDVQAIQNSDKFREAVEAVARDKSATAKVTIHPAGSTETLPLRVYAMRTLAAIERTERSAKVLALIWHDASEPAEIREGAIRAFAFIVEWPGPAKDSMANRPAMNKTLYPFLAPLMLISDAESDKKEEAGPKAQVSDLGNAASCAVERFPKELRAKARKGEAY